jgi:hypothetical protein
LTEVPPLEGRTGAWYNTTATMLSYSIAGRILDCSININRTQQ